MLKKQNNKLQIWS